MNRTRKPNLVIVAGPNGAGKSTVADFLITNRSIDNYINADVIAKGMAVSENSGSDIMAGRVLLNAIETSLDKGQSFAFESTMAGSSWRKLLKDARTKGYEITICYVAVDSVDTALIRIRQRVAEGGHNIPNSTVRRRYQRSLEMFFSAYRHLCDCWYFFDNSGTAARLVASMEENSNPLIILPELWRKYERR